ncbi:hypothetical protein LTR53_011488 [Teratosphaeriaceae sp. CCFEE 6253]|nr:hypothetical protein LTR53_011488 [Teratosphaeriaceae sp. CCFEE 6253]
MDDSPLRKLPPEMLNEIYKLALLVPEGITIVPHRPRPSASKCDPTALEGRQSPDLMGMLTLTMVCRELRGLTWSMFFATNRFTIHSDYIERSDNPRCEGICKKANTVIHVATFLRKFGHENARLAADVTIFLGVFAWSGARVPFEWLWKEANAVHGLLDRQGAILPIRQFNIGVCLSQHRRCSLWQEAGGEEKDLSPCVEYVLPCYDRERTERSLREAWSAAQHAIKDQADTFDPHDWEDLHLGICEAVLEPSQWRM